MEGIVGRMISTQILLFMYTLCGIIISKVGIIREDNRKVLVRLLMDVAVPMMILDAFNKPTTPDEIRSSFLVMAIAAASCGLAALAGLFLWRKQPEDRRKVLLYATMFSNAGMAGLPVVNLVFGSTGVFFASMYLIPPRILQWTVGLGLFIKPEKGAWVKNVLLNPVVVVVYIGFALMATNWQIPGVFSAAIANIGDMTGPLSMMLIGATIAQMKANMLFDKNVLEVSFVRLFGIPIAVGVLLKLLGADAETLMICVILLAMPVASNTASITERYGGDYPFASACVSVSTLLSCVTVPVMTWAIQQIPF